MAAGPWPEGVIQLRSTRGAYAYVVAARETDADDGSSPPTGPVLIDTGLPGRAKAILAELRQHDVPTLSDIVVSHGDVDHIGNLAALVEATGARAWLPKGDRPYIMEGRPRPGVKRLIGAIVHVRPPAAAADLIGGDRVGPLVVIATPGHSPGHLAFAGPGFLAVGDALASVRGKIVPSHGLLAWDSAEAAASATRILAGYRGWILPAHQEPFWYEDPRRASAPA
jgi:glyoxylase-like metal-dependent hydrolase (beta-lactamase superfamily II)